MAFLFLNILKFSKNSEYLSKLSYKNVKMHRIIRNCKGSYSHNRSFIVLEFSKAENAIINKRIDEIAFQTAFLALNAAVEAALTGEAGTGLAPFPSGLLLQ
jgi:hypothetical protein